MPAEAEMTGGVTSLGEGVVGGAAGAKGGGGPSLLPPEPGKPVHLSWRLAGETLEFLLLIVIQNTDVL